jgi:hypothetical protein
MLINLFPAETAGVQAVAALALAAIALGVGVMVAVIWRRAARRRLASELAHRHGLSARSAGFLAQLLRRERAGARESLLATPELLARRLALAVVRQRGAAAALGTAAHAGRLLDELGAREPAFEGAPLPCEPLVLTDPADPAHPGVRVFVVAVDEKNLVAVSASPCPWPLRRSLLATPERLPGAGESASPGANPDSPRGGPAAPESSQVVTHSPAPASLPAATHSPASLPMPSSRPAFGVALLLRPMPPQHEWVLTHALVDTITNRRAAVRVPCRIESFALPDSGDPLLVRQRLQREESVALEELRGSRAWSQRLSVTVTDLSADGARLVLDQPLTRRQRLHLIFADAGGSLLALPLAEVVDSRHDDAGRTVAGVRFIGVRMKERLRLADLVRSLAVPPAKGGHRLPRGPARQRGPGL